MAGYHQYVFDTAKRLFVGNFEQMYKNEEGEHFDSWHQEDCTLLNVRMSLTILDAYQFPSILDVGCGKGVLTHLLKKKNNDVVGIDLSQTAILKARTAFPQVDFRVLDAQLIESLGRTFDLIVVMEILSYLEDWQAFLERCSRMTSFLFIKLYVPPDPIGFVKSFNELTREVEKHFEIVTHVLMKTESCLLLMGKTRRKEQT